MVVEDLTGGMDLSKAFRKGQVRICSGTGTNGFKGGPPAGYAWLVLYGIVNHVTGTISDLTVRIYVPQLYAFADHAITNYRIEAAAASGPYPFGTQVVSTMTNMIIPSLFLIPYGCGVQFSGDATATFKMVVWEFEST